MSLGVDARVMRTRTRLREALVTLVLERGYDAVTIKDLTERAQVGYATYFRHYPDKDTLLLELLDGLLAELMLLLGPTLADEDSAGNAAKVFAHVRDNVDLYRVLISSQRSVDVLSRASRVASGTMASSLHEAPEGLLPVGAAVYHVVRSFVSLIEWWLLDGAAVSPDVMGEAFERLVMGPVRELTFRPMDG